MTFQTDIFAAVVALFGAGLIGYGICQIRFGLREMREKKKQN